MRRAVYSAGQGSLPGLGFAEQCIARCRAVFRRDEVRDAAKLDAGRYLWEICFTEKDRRFLLRLSDLGIELAGCTWAELSDYHKAKLIQRARGLIEWATKMRAAIDRLQRERA